MGAASLVGDLLTRTARLHGETVALEDERRRVTYRELGDEVELLAARLCGLGVGAGDRVAFLADNRIELVALYFATARAGAVCVPLNARLQPAELADVLRDAGAVAIVVDATHAPRIDALRDQVPSLRLHVDLDAATPGWRTLADVVPADPAHAAAPDDVIVQMYTSGTTGRPKGAMLTHRNLTWKASAWLPYMPLRHGSRYLQVTPLFHVGGFAMMVVAASAGATVILHPKFEPDRAAHDLAARGITHTLMVPAMLRWMLLEPAARDQRFPLLERLLYGASPMPTDLLVEAMDRLGCAFVQGYGLTETTAILTVLEPDDHRFDRAAGPPRRLASAGRALPGCEVRVVDGDDRVVGPGVIGEVVARGPNVMVGYWGMPEATADALRGGWFHTGDLATFDDEGYLTIVDRKKDMILVGGENVYPAEVEATLRQHPSVADVAVIGVPHEVWGEAVVALVVPAPGVTADPALGRALIRACRGVHAQFKCPTRVEFLGALPRNAAGKVRKAELRAPFWEGRTRLV